MKFKIGDRVGRPGINSIDQYQFEIVGIGPFSRGDFLIASDTEEKIYCSSNNLDYLMRLIKLPDNIRGGLHWGKEDQLVLIEPADDGVIVE